MGIQISWLRDDFSDNFFAPAWQAITSGSGTVAETGGQAVLTLPSSTAGTHEAYYRTSGTYDSTGDGFSVNIGTMVATGVAAQATFDMYADASNILRWRQLSGTITARKTVAGVDTQLYTAAWNASTYKYLRITESGGTINFASSTNGTSWTTRASIVGLPFAVTDLFIQFGASCGNIASPGSLRMDDVNLLPALATNWNDTTVEWPLLNRYRVVTIAANSGQGYIAIASEATSRNADGTPNALETPRYFSGPMGSSSGGFNQLTEYSSQASAQAMAVDLPTDSRWDMAGVVECRFIRLYHRSITGSSYALREYYPRRLVQADDIEAESIRAINIAAGTITADKMFVLDLSAITANIGQLTLTSGTGANAWLYQGTGSGDAPTTGLKIFNSGGIGKLSTYNTTVEQITLDTDGKLKAGAGVIQLDSGGLKIIVPTDDNYLANGSLKFQSSGGTVYADIYALDFSTAPLANQLRLTSNAVAGQVSGVYTLAESPTTYEATVQLAANSGGSSTTIFRVIADDNARNYASLTRTLDITEGLNVGSATGAGTGEISTSGNVAVGSVIASTTRLYTKGVDATSSNYSFIAQNSSGTNIIAARNDNRIGFLGAAVVARPVVTGSRGGNAALASLITGLANLGLVTDSSSA